jgi:hypothetical protein
MHGWAQSAAGPQPMAGILTELEKRFNLTFSYLETTIQGIVLQPPAAGADLEQTLEYLNRATGLVFHRIGSGDIAISAARDNLTEFCGIIADRRSGLPLAGATIQSSAGYAVSDDQGRFMLNASGLPDTLFIRHLGHQSRSVAVQPSGMQACDTLFLTESLIRLEEIVVSNLLTRGVDKKADGSVTLSPQDFGILPGLTDPDILLTVQALPGIQSANELVSDINVRGGSHDQNLFLWDGIKMYLTGHFFGLISAFNPYLMREVNVIKNGTPAAFSDGVSSIIDMRTGNALPEKFTAGAGSNLLFADVFAKIPISRRLALQVSARRSIAGLAKTVTYDKYFDRAFRNTGVTDRGIGQDTTGIDNQQFGFYDFSARLLYEISPRDRLDVSFLHIHNDITFRKNGFAGDPATSKSSGLAQGTLGTGLNYHRTWKNGFRISAGTFLSSYLLEGINSDIGNDQRLIQENEVLDTGIKLDAGYPLTDHLDLSVGYQFFETGVSNLEDINNPPFRRLIKKVIRSHAGYSELNYSRQGTLLRLGLRANYIEKFNRWLPEPRVAFSQSLLRHFTLELLGEYKHQTATQIIDLQTDFLGVEKRRWVLADGQEIPVMTSRQLSLGLQFERGGLLMSADAYIKQVDGLTTSSQGFQNQFQFVRATGAYEVMGLDVLLRKQQGNLNAWISYSFADNTYTFPSLQPPSFPSNYDIRHVVNLGSSYTLNNLLLSAGINWHSGRPYTEPTGVENGEIAFASANSSRLDDYLRIDLSARYRFKIGKGGHGEVGASVWNLMNRTNVLNIFYRLDNNGQPLAIRQHALAFTPNLMFRVEF